jgi:hypothetical protein
MKPSSERNTPIAEDLQSPIARERDWSPIKAISHQNKQPNVQSIEREAADRRYSTMAAAFTRADGFEFNIPFASVFSHSNTSPSWSVFSAFPSASVLHHSAFAVSSRETAAQTKWPVPIALGTVWNLLGEQFACEVIPHVPTVCLSEANSMIDFVLWSVPRSSEIPCRLK